VSTSQVAAKGNAYFDGYYGEVLGAFTKLDVDDFTSEHVKSMMTVMLTGQKEMERQCDDQLDQIRKAVVEEDLLVVQEYMRYLELVCVSLSEDEKKYIYELSTAMPIDTKKDMTRYDAEQIIHYFNQLPKVYTVLSKSQAFSNEDLIAINPGSNYYFEIPMTEYKEYVSKYNGRM